MPYSAAVFDEVVAGLLRRMTPPSVLDVGAGAGKYGRLVKESCPGTLTTAVEVHAAYIDQFDLAQLYDSILCMDATRLLETAVDASYSLVILGDVLEHLPKTRGVDLLHFLTYRSHYILAIFPTEYLQNTVFGNRFEAHVSIWGGPDFALMDHSQIYSYEGSCLVLVRGYLAPADELKTYSSFLDAAVNLLTQTPPGGK